MQYGPRLMDLILEKGKETRRVTETSRETLDIHGDWKIFHTPYAGNKFRQWVNDNYPEYSKEEKLNTTGSYQNSYIKNAYSKYGDEYEQEKSVCVKSVDE